MGSWVLSMEHRGDSFDVGMVGEGIILGGQPDCLGYHLYGNKASRTENLILFWAVVAANYRQLCFPSLFLGKNYLLYLLTRIIYFFFAPFWTLFLPLFFHFTHQENKQTKKLLPLEDVYFPGCGENDRAGLGRRTQEALVPAGDGCEAEGADCGLRIRREMKQGAQRSGRGRAGGQEVTDAERP